MRLVQTQHGVRPTALYPLWQGMAFGLGAATALMGRHAAMACTEAVETVIGEHYDEYVFRVPVQSSADPTARSASSSHTSHLKQMGRSRTRRSLS